MIEIPIGKALIAVETEVPPEYGVNNKACRGCIFSDGDCHVMKYLSCWTCHRKDGKNVIFKLVDYIEGTKPVKEEKKCIQISM